MLGPWSALMFERIEPVGIVSGVLQTPPRRVAYLMVDALPFGRMP